MLPILGLMFGTMERVDTTAVPTYSGSIGDYFTYIKDLAYYSIQRSIDQYGAVQVLAVLCAITAGAFLLRNIFRYLGAFLLVNYRVKITRDLRSAMYTKFLHLPVSFFTEKRKGDMMSRISNDIGAVDNGIMGSLVDVVNSPFMILTSLVTLFSLP